MSRASIYDLLQQRTPPVVEKPVVVEERSDFRTDRLRLVDGVAVTAAGVLAMDMVPEGVRAELSQSMRGPDGFPLMACAVQEVMPVNEARLRNHEPKALRLHELIQTSLHDALMMLEALPENERFDIVVSLALRSPETASLLLEQIQLAVKETEYGERLGEIRHNASGWNPHHCLAVSEAGGHPHVLWISADSLINVTEVSRLEQRGLLRRTARPEGLVPGEAAVALLMQRALEDDIEYASGWWLDSAAEQEHAPRSSKARGRKGPSIVKELLEQSWPDAADDADAEEPSRVVVDALGLPGRSTEVAGPLTERWSELDLIDHGINVAHWCGWPGEALTALQLLLAVAPLSDDESAVVLNVVKEQSSRSMVLRSCAASRVGGNGAEDAERTSANGEGSAS
ncbi:hypothetical protein [Halomonas huangheensis]|uniref:Uncharacterized protein n=1 Tax=Halomonas huangheensis TaxID=1178482 RepID=W1NAV3_9GAMM|nr:hypothetical protein [Halomonas huangheensis]ALM53980.1 hypothetical protein AR456_18155 [Halomonas huangheensis]ERL52060.1 hypothetical protein BJB45_08845 [Halomonas huangheensis]